jgi:hypothetical protein
LKHFLFAVFFTSVSISSFAQRTKEVQNQNHFWWSINSTIKVHKQWSAIADFHIRRTNYLKNNNFYYTRLVPPMPLIKT